MYPSDDSSLRVRLLIAPCRAARERLQQRLEEESGGRGPADQERRAHSPFPALSWIAKMPGQDER